MQAARFRLIRLAAPQRGGKGRFVIGTQEPKNFCSATPRSLQGHWPKIIKVFLLLFVHKKKFFLFSCFLR